MNGIEVSKSLLYEDMSIKPHLAIQVRHQQELLFYMGGCLAAWGNELTVNRKHHAIQSLQCMCWQERAAL